MSSSYRSIEYLSSILDVLVKGKMSVNYFRNMVAIALISRPAENDEIYLESRSSELLLRNGISDISGGQCFNSVELNHLVLRADRLVYCRYLALEIVEDASPDTSVCTGE